MFTPNQQAFRKEICAWVQENLPPGWHDVMDFEAPERASLIYDWRRKLASKGWLTLAWPKENGGGGADFSTQLVFCETMASLGISVEDVGATEVGPVLIAYGTEAQKDYWLKDISEARWTWAQIYGESGPHTYSTPSLTYSVDEQGQFVMNGSKLLGSASVGPDMGLLLAGTALVDSGIPNHYGASLFVVDLHSPGVEAMRDSTNWPGSPSVVWFNDVRVPKANIVGVEGEGWVVTQALSGFEQLGLGTAAEAQYMLDRLIKFSKEASDHSGKPIMHHPAFRERIAQLAVEVNVAKVLTYHVVQRKNQGKLLGMDLAMTRSFASGLRHRIAVVAMQAIGMWQNLEVDGVLTRLKGHLAARCRRAFNNGSNGYAPEIQRNIIATRGLGLPRGI